MAALVAVMIMVSVGTMDWHSVHPTTLRTMPRSATAIMVVTVVATIGTHNLAVGVGAGVVTSMVFFARRVAHFTEVIAVDWPDDDTRVYSVRGVLFFASSNDLVYQFDYSGSPSRVVIDLSDAQIYDSSTVAALDAAAVDGDLLGDAPLNGVILAAGRMALAAASSSRGRGDLGACRPAWGSDATAVTRAFAAVTLLFDPTVPRQP